MLTFNIVNDEYVFLHNDNAVAYGMYNNQRFELFFNDEILTFANAMQAFCHVKTILLPKQIAKPETIELFTTPSRPIDNMSKFTRHQVLVGMSKEVFHALE